MVEVVMVVDVGMRVSFVGLLDERSLYLSV